MTQCRSLTSTLLVAVQLLGALDDGDSSVCSTVDYQPPEPEPEEVEEEEEVLVEPESCFTEGGTARWTCGGQRSRAHVSCFPQVA